MGLLALAIVLAATVALVAGSSVKQTIASELDVEIEPMMVEISTSDAGDAFIGGVPDRTSVNRLLSLSLFVAGIAGCCCAMWRAVPSNDVPM